jgi:FkbM family methyltransferase
MYLAMGYTTKVGDFQIIYPNKTEFRILKKEIFDQEIYKMDLQTDTPKIFDLGGYVGLSAIYFKQQYPNSHIEIFEPNPNVHHFLEENIFGNSLSGIQIHKVAVDDKSGQRDFYLDNSGNYCFSTAGFRENAWDGTQKTTKIKVHTETLSKYIGNQVVDLLKIDTEGNELKILKEIENQLPLVKNLIIEYHPIKKKNLKDIINILSKNNYELSYYYEGNKIESPINDLMLIKAQSK